MSSSNQKQNNFPFSKQDHVDEEVNNEQDDSGYLIRWYNNQMNEYNYVMHYLLQAKNATIKKAN
jgi:hypothetical protein